jgi:NodT family efflux transporter outer membrane factor (OMF) lipoprotein
LRLRAGPLACGLAALALASCEVGPDFHRPAPPSVGGYTPGPLPAETANADTPGGAGQRLTQGLDVAGRWWMLFQSTQLNALVDEALKANPDLQAAQAALRAARENYAAQTSALLPTVEATYNVTREQASATPAPPLTSNINLFTLHTAQLNIAYTADVFGGIRRQNETLQAQADAQRYQTEATYLTLTSNLVAAAIQSAMLHDQIEATRALIRSDHEVLDIMRRQFELGEIARSDLAGQEAAVAQAEQTLPPLEKQLAQQKDLIANLIGRFPSQAEPQDFTLEGFRLPTDLPVSLPSQIVEQRPDIKAAEANLHAASSQVGVAIANRLPNITLSANAGGASTDIGKLFSNSNAFWTVAGNVAQPIFQGGALLHRQRAAEAMYEQAKAQYQSTLLSAFHNVADTLQALDTDARTLKAAVAAEQSAELSLKIARRQLELGQVSGIVVLTAEQSYQQAAIARVQAQASRYSDTAALFQALGGGWWNRNETSTSLR